VLIDSKNFLKSDEYAKFIEETDPEPTTLVELSRVKMITPKKKQHHSRKRTREHTTPLSYRQPIIQEEKEESYSSNDDEGSQPFEDIEVPQ